MSLSIQADDLPTAEPAPAEATTQPDVLPTAEPQPEITVEPSPVTPAATTEPTQQATIEPSPVTPAATTEPTQEVTQIANTPAPTPNALTFPLLYSAAFEGSDAPGLTVQDGWTEVLVEGGKALQPDSSAVPVSYTYATLSEGAVEARFWLVSGEAQVQLGGYRASLAADGTATLFRNELAVASSSVVLTPDTWTLLRLHITGAQVQISANGVLVVDYMDVTPLPGHAAFAASSDAMLRIDDFAVYGVAIQPTPLPPTALPIPRAVTLLAPDDGSTFVIGQSLSWQALADGPGSPFTYNVQISSDAAFTTLEAHADALTQTSLPLPPLAQGLYYWRVQAVNQYAIAGAWTQRSLNIPFQLAVPVLSPAQLTESGRPNFLWSTVAEAINYTIEVNDICGDGTFTYQVTTAGNGSYQVPESVARLPQGEYSYCIKASDGQGHDSLYSPQTPLKIAYNYTPLDGEARGTGLTLPLQYYSFGNSTNTYKFYIDNEPTFTAPFTYQSGFIGYYNGIGLHNAPSISTPGTYYWRVERFINGTPEPITSLVSNKLIIGTSGSAPSLLTPANGSLISVSTVLSWAKSVTLPSFSTITHYQVHISTLSNFSNVVVKENISAAATQQYTFVPPANTTNQTYYWRVMGINADQQQVTLSQTRNFVVDNVPLPPPTITSPVANSGLNTVRPQFTWTAVSEAVGYRLAVQNSSTLVDVITERSVSGTSFLSPLDLPAGSYVLRVRSTDAYGNIGVFSTVAFTINASVPTSTPTSTRTPFPPTATRLPATATLTPTPIPPPVVTGLLPGNSAYINAASSSTTNFSWGAATGVSMPYTYDVQFSLSSAFSTIAHSAANLTDTTYPSSNVVDGTYYWRVRAVNKNGVAGAWSSSQIVSIDRIVPTVAATPLGVQFANTGRPRLDWNTTGLSRFIAEVNDVCGDETPIFRSAMVSTSSVFISANAVPLQQGDYTYCVRGFDMAANEGPFSTLMPFSIAYHVLPNNKTVAPTELKWSNVGGLAGQVITYKVQIDDETTFTEPLAYESAPVSTTSIAAPVLAPGVYHWHIIRLVDGAAEPVGAMAYRTYLAGEQTSAPILTAPDNDVTINAPVLLKWNPPTTVGNLPITHYVVEYFGENFGVGFPVSVDGPLETLYTPTANQNGVMFNWRVIPYHNEYNIQIGAPASSYRSFIVDTVAPNAPTITAPANDDMVLPLSATFRWGYSVGDTSYTVAIQDTATQTDIVPEHTLTNIIAFREDLPEGNYVLRVRANDNINSSAWATRSFSVSSLVTPSPTVVGGGGGGGGIFATNTPPATLTASPLPPPTSTKTPTITPTKTATSIPPTATLTPTKTATLVLNAPTLQAPAANAVIRDTRQPVFSWDVVPQVSNYTLRLYEGVNNQVGISLGTQLGLTTNSFIMPAPLQQGHYMWRILGTGGSTTPWSAYRSFVINAALSPAPDSIITTVGSDTTAAIPFTWTAVGKNVIARITKLDGATPPTTAECSATSASNTCTIADVGYGTYSWNIAIKGETYVGSPVHSDIFHVRPPAPPAVTHITPADGRYLPPAERPNVVLEWNWGSSPAPAGGDFTYNVEIDTVNTFAAPIASAANLTTPTFTTAALLDSTYYWRVQAVNVFGITGAWSAPFSFIVDSVAPLSAPVINLPVANSVIAPPRYGFQWIAVSDAYRYSVEVNEVCGDGSPLHLSSTLITTNFYPMPNTESGMPQGTHTVCVTAYDQSDNSITSAPQTFSVFMGILPSSGALIAPTVKPDFAAWLTPELGQTVTYQFQIDPTGDDFTSSDILSAISSTSTLTWATTLPQGEYSWRVLHLINGVPQPFTHPLSRKFYIGTLAAGPAITSPANNALISGVTPLTWDVAFSNVNAPITDYEVQVSKNAAYTQIVSEAIVPAALMAHNFEPALNQNIVTHYWRVRGRSSGVAMTNWSSRTVRVDNVAPAQPVVTAPVAESMLNTTRPTFTWAAVPSATKYRVTMISASSSQEIMTKEVTTLTLIPALPLVQDDLILQVSAWDGINWGRPTSVNFKVRLGTAPAQNAVVTTNRPAFTWAGVLGATGYTLRVDNDADFSSPLIDRTTTGAGYTLTAAEALPAGIYYWHVRSSNVDFPVGNASRTFSYGVALKPANLMTSAGASLAAASITPMLIFNLRQMEGTGVTFSWNAVTPTPQRYQLEISPTSLFPRVGLIQQFVTQGLVDLRLDSVVDGLKYWRVRAIYNAEGTSFGPWSDVKSFTLDRTLPPVPVLKGASGVVISTARPTFSWIASIGAARYILNVTDQATGQPVPQLTNIVTTAATYTLPTAQPALSQNNSQGYTWTVQAEDAAGNRSAVSMRNTLYVFSGLTPSAGQIVADTTPLFTWTAVAGKAGWTLQIANDAAMTEALYSSPLLAAAATTFTLPTARTPGLHYWRVIRTGEDTSSIQGQPFYIVSTLVGAAPVPTLPINGKTLNQTDINAGAALTWTAPINPGISGLVVGYKVEIAKLNTFTAASLVASQTVSNPTLPLPALLDGLYYWRVRAVFAPNNALGPVSAVLSFKLDQTAPGNPTLTLPITNAVVTATRTPTFTWLAATGTPTQYILEIDNEADFSSVAYTVTLPLSLTHKLPLANALPNNTYYWRVRAKDAAGNLSTGAARSFTIAVP